MEVENIPDGSSADYDQHGVFKTMSSVITGLGWILLILGVLLVIVGISQGIEQEVVFQGVKVDQIMNPNVTVGIGSILSGLFMVWLGGLGLLLYDMRSHLK
jgi:hypothetical protein